MTREEEIRALRLLAAQFKQKAETRSRDTDRRYCEGKATAFEQAAQILEGADPYRFTAYGHG